jgi:hypothetical protein
MSDRREHGVRGLLVSFVIGTCLGYAHAFSASISLKYTKRSVGISSNTRRIVTFSRITPPRESLSLSEVQRALSAGNYIVQPTFMAGKHISALDKVHAAEIPKRRLERNNALAPGIKSPIRPAFCRQPSTARAERPSWPSSRIRPPT